VNDKEKLDFLLEFTRKESLHGSMNICPYCVNIGNHKCEKCWDLNAFPFWDFDFEKMKNKVYTDTDEV
jgi:hypothetical protein